MNRFPVFAPLLVTIVLGWSISYAQTYDLQFTLNQNDGATYAVTAQIRSNFSTFRMGISNLTFTYDSSAIGTPVLDSAFNFNSGLYNAITLTAPAGDRVSINIVYNGAAGSGTTVPANFINIVRIRFKTKKGAGHSTLQWRTITPNQTGVFDDGAALVAKGTLFGFDTILLGVANAATGTPTKYSLSQNYPNPFNPSTQISFSITKGGQVSLRVYDILGREIAALVNENRKAGLYTERFDGNQMSSGVYIYVLKTAEGQLTGRMMLLK